MKPASILIRCLAVSVFVASGVRVLSQGVPLGQFEGHGDIGAPTNAGSASYNAEEIEGYTAQMRFLYDQLARLERDCKTPPQRHYTPGGGLELRGDPGPAATGTVNPRSGDPLAPPPMPKAKSMPQPKPID